MIWGAQASGRRLAHYKGNSHLVCLRPTAAASGRGSCRRRSYLIQFVFLLRISGPKRDGWHAGIQGPGLIVGNIVELKRLPGACCSLPAPSDGATADSARSRTWLFTLAPLHAPVASCSIYVAYIHTYFFHAIRVADAWRHTARRLSAGRAVPLPKRAALPGPAPACSGTLDTLPASWNLEY